MTKKTPAKADKVKASAKKRIVSLGNSAFGLQSQAAELIDWIQTQAENNEPFYKLIDLFPIPIEIFAPDGCLIFINRAMMDLNNVKDAGLAVGRYNLLKDKICNDVLGMRQGIQKAFRGEPFFFPNFPVPIQDVIDRGVAKEKPFEKATMDYILFPIWKDDRLHFIVCVFIVKNLYFGRPDITRAKEYIDSHWQEEFDPDAVAKSVGMSKSQFYNVFKQHTGMSPGEYYRKRKVEHIKEKLADKSLSIKEAFAACGEDSQSWMLKAFKEETGKTPTQFRVELP